MLRIIPLSLICLGLSGFMLPSVPVETISPGAAIDSTSTVKNAESDSTAGKGKQSRSDEWQCGTYNGHALYTGPEGGCYYYNSSDKKTYVDRSKCNC